MKQPYISLFAEEYPLYEKSNLVYDHLTQVNYLDKSKSKIAADFGPRDKSIETRVIENSDTDESYYGPNTTIETATLEDTDQDGYSLLGPDTTKVTETVENGDVESHFGPPTTRTTFVVENDDETEVIMGPDSTRITKTLENSDPDEFSIL